MKHFLNQYLSIFLVRIVFYFQNIDFNIKNKNNIIKNIEERTENFILKSLPKVNRHYLKPLDPLTVLNFTPYGDFENYDLFYEIILKTEDISILSNYFFKIKNVESKKNKELVLSDLEPHSKIFDFENMRNLINFYYSVPHIIEKSKSSLFIILIKFLEALGVDYKNPSNILYIDEENRIIRFNFRDSEIHFRHIIMENKINYDPNIEIYNYIREENKKNERLVFKPKPKVKVINNSSSIIQFVYDFCIDNLKDYLDIEYEKEWSNLPIIEKKWSKHLWI